MFEIFIVDLLGVKCVESHFIGVFPPKLQVFHEWLHFLPEGLQFCQWAWWLACECQKVLWCLQTGPVCFVLRRKEKKRETNKVWNESAPHSLLNCWRSAQFLKHIKKVSSIGEQDVHDECHIDRAICSLVALEVEKRNCWCCGWCWCWCCWCCCWWWWGCRCCSWRTWHCHGGCWWNDKVFVDELVNHIKIECINGILLICQWTFNETKSQIIFIQIDSLKCGKIISHIRNKMQKAYFLTFVCTWFPLRCSRLFGWSFRN